jgi:hypothetical protein
MREMLDWVPTVHTMYGSAPGTLLELATIIALICGLVGLMLVLILLLENGIKPRKLSRIEIVNNGRKAFFILASVVVLFSIGPWMLYILWVGIAGAAALFMFFICRGLYVSAKELLLEHFDI